VVTEAIKKDLAPAEGTLGVLLVGLGAVATTFVAGVENIRRGHAKAVGSLGKMATIRLGKRTEGRSPLIEDFVPLASLDDMVFGAWDPISDDAYESCKVAGVLDAPHIEPIKDFLQTIKPMPAVFDRNYVKRLDGTNVKQGKTKRELAEQLREDIRSFKAQHKCDRLVMVWCASTEVFIQPGPAHESLAALEQAMDANDDTVAPSMLYAWASLMEGVPFANGAPNLTVDTLALQELAELKSVAICGKDFKTGQTLMKTVLSPMLKARMLGLAGWYSTNILGNRDGERRSPSSGSWTTSCSPPCTRTCTATSTTRCGSTTIRRAVITRRVGTTSTSSDGSAIRCRSRSTSSAAIRSWRRRSYWIWRCFSIWRSAPGWWGSRSGCPSTSRARWRRRA
jgi:myo-inositol-1-phosphate synthase